MNTLTPAGRAGRIAGQAARLTVEAIRRVDWREVAAIVGQGLTVLLALLVLAVPATYRAGKALRLAIHRAALVIAREHAYMVGVCPPLEALQPVVPAPVAAPAAPAAPAPGPRPLPKPIPFPVPMPPAAQQERVIRLHRAGRPKAAIARELGIPRTTVRRWLAAA